MMSHRTNSDQQVEAALSSLEGISRAKANPFLYIRISACLERQSNNSWQLLGYWLSRPLVALAAGLLVIMMNVFLLVNHHPADLAARDEDQVMAGDYSYAPPAEETNYLINEEQP